MHGVHTALVTPFRNGAVDLQAFGALCERQVAAGVHGLVPCGTTGEAPTLTASEWSALVRDAVAAARGRVPVTAGCGTNNTTTTVQNIEAAGALGADAALVVFPYYNKPNPAGLMGHVRAAAAVGLPVVLYHVPGRTGQRLGVGQLADLCGVDGVIAVKEATGDLIFGQHLLECTDRAVLSGDDFTFAALVAMGGAGVISVLSNLAPALTVAWHTAANTGDVQTLRASRERLMPVVRYLFDDTNPVPIKAAMAALDLCAAEVRAPLAAATSGPQRALLSGLH